MGRLTTAGHRGGDFVRFKGMLDAIFDCRASLSLHGLVLDGASKLQWLANAMETLSRSS